MIQTYWKQPTILTNIIITLAIIALHSQITTASISHPAAHIHRGLDEDYLRCTVYELDALALTTNDTEEQTTHEFSCAADDHGPTVSLKGDRGKFFSKKLVSGVTSLTIPTELVSAHLQVDLNDPKSSKMIVVSYGDEVRGLRGGHMKRSLRADYEGTFGVLVVRVSDNRGHSPTHSAEEISRHIFTDALTMASQYRACSNDKLRFVPADGSDVVNGVLEITVDRDLSSSYQSKDCVIAADNIISSSSYDLGIHTYTMYICPDVVDFGVAAGVADINGSKSWYLDKYGSMPFVQMHEMGHNLAFYHSSEGGLEYGDPTGIMGGFFEEDAEWGRMCFNAAKTYTTGWYSTHHGDVSPHSASYKGNLVDVNSASIGLIHDKDDVVVRVQTPNNVNNLYLMLHRLEGITSDMSMGGPNDPKYEETHANRVNIVLQAYSRGVPSQAVAHLASGEEYTQDDWADTGKALHIKVCSITEGSNKNRGAKVIIYLEGENFTRCDDDTDEESVSPVAPTSAPVSPSPTVEEVTSPPSPTCTDSTLKMFIRGGAKRGCSWVAANNTEERCEIPGVASHCPVTCGTCMLCIDSGKRFQMKNKAKDIKSCSWVRNTQTASRCKKEGVASACRATCGTCNA